MSEFIDGIEAEEDRPIESRGDLIAYFARGGKPRTEWKVGTEWEKVGVDVRTGRAVPYSGPRGIEQLLARLSERFGWEPRRERGRIIALKGRAASITLEPGGQVELSGEKCESIHCTRRELLEHVRQLEAVGEEVGIAFLGLGVQPVSTVEEIEMVPKRRYEIMAPYMARVGTLGLAMMKQTAAIQVNFDYADEADAMSKMRVASGIVPLIAAMFANSSIAEGKVSAFMSLRGHIWTKTDPERAGLLRFVLEEEGGFDAYVDYALSVPLYFIARKGELIDAVTGMPFRTFLERGHDGQRATLHDWSLHLTTLFPEVRLKRYIELRTADSQQAALMPAVPALVKGILYEEDCRLAAWDLVKKWTWEERNLLLHDVYRMALQARVGRLPVIDLAKDLLAIATEGLERQRKLNDQGEDESIYLEGLEAQLRGGMSQGRLVAQKWEEEWGGDIGKLVVHCRI